MKVQQELKKLLDDKADLYNRPSFISADPICIPHLFTRLQDIEIAGFFAAMLAWGNRTTIIKKAKELMELMEMQPYEFCINPTRERLERLLGFRHRTFNATDLLYFVDFFHHHYQHHSTLESAFTRHGTSMYDMLSGFHQYFFSLPDAPSRTRKHIATPERGSACKRLNMYLRWMVRKDHRKVDFGIWTTISPSLLICPVDLHVARVARQLKLLTRKQTDWLAAEELTANLRQLDAADPARYDFALFAMGIIERH